MRIPKLRDTILFPLPPSLSSSSSFLSSFFSSYAAPFSTISSVSSSSSSCFSIFPFILSSSFSSLFASLPHKISLRKTFIESRRRAKAPRFSPPATLSLPFSLSQDFSSYPPLLHLQKPSSFSSSTSFLPSLYFSLSSSSSYPLPRCLRSFSTSPSSLLSSGAERSEKEESAVVDREECKKREEKKSKRGDGKGDKKKVHKKVAIETRQYEETEGEGRDKETVERCSPQREEEEEEIEGDMKRRKTFLLVKRVKALEKQLASIQRYVKENEVHMKEYVLDKMLDLEDELRALEHRHHPHPGVHTPQSSSSSSPSFATSSPSEKANEKREEEEEEENILFSVNSPSSSPPSSLSSSSSSSQTVLHATPEYFCSSSSPSSPKKKSSKRRKEKEEEEEEERLVIDPITGTIACAVNATTSSSPSSSSSPASFSRRDERS
ncbi:hypothetical protein CSUI_007180 [Cystoisospora suis]|uniref:Uncharacterized protein n=1 Tax=Cystoisospora suis TaxID=483139 RepID=A0A2C6KPD4_9APIC|nr:hypothetical protein CSUI_007180 [Cystoisospora suis]